MIVPDLFHADNDLDFAFIMEHAVREVDKNLTVKITKSGREALTSLNQLVLQPQKPRLIFLNDNLHDMPAINLLSKIRETDYFTEIPIIIFSEPDDSSVSSNALKPGVNAFYPRPASYRELVNLLKAICNLWMITKKHA